MDLFEKFNRSFGSWYEGLFGGSDDVRPKDILRRILAAMEDHRKEGFDNRVYVPNSYVLEINVDDEEEKEYLLSFLDRDELEAAIRRYCQQNHYHIRGALDFTIKEVDDPELRNKKGEKVRVRCRYNSKITGPEPVPAVHAANPASGLPPIGGSLADPYRAHAAAPGQGKTERKTEWEERTVADVWQQDDETGTVPAIARAALVVYAPDRAPFRYDLARQTVKMGRSPRANNEITIESDGQISKQHARLDLDDTGRFTLTDMGSTNGTKVNGKRVETRLLNDGDEITLGATRILFQQTPLSAQDVDEERPTLYVRPDTELRAGGEREPVLSAPGSHANRDAEAGNGRIGGAFGGAAAVLPRPEARPLVEHGEQSSGPLPPIRPLRTRTARLILLGSGKEAPVVDDFLLASETTLGRGVTNDIVLPDRSLATRHARILNNGDAYTLEHITDEPVRTTLNDLILATGHPERLKDGDRIGLGDLCLRFEAGQ